MSSFFKETGKLKSNVQKVIKEAVSICIQCASRKVTRNLNEKKGYFSPQLFHTINMDIAGPLPQTKSGNRFILSIIDVFSKYVSLYPVKNMHSKTIIAILEKFLDTMFWVSKKNYYRWRS